MTRGFTVYYYIEEWKIPYTSGRLLSEIQHITVELDFNKVVYRPRYWKQQFEDAILLAEIWFRDNYDELKYSMMPVKVEITAFEQFNTIQK